MTATDGRVVRADDQRCRTLLDRSSFLLLHFRADWCRPCNGAMAPVLADIAATYEDLVVATVDAEAGRAAVEAFDVETLLTTVLLADGEEVARFRGRTPYVELARAVEANR